MTLTVADQLDVAIILDAEYLPKLQASVRLYMRHGKDKVVSEAVVLAMPFDELIAAMPGISEKIRAAGDGGDSWKKKLEGLNS